MFTDIKDDVISIGDIVVFSAPGYGAGVSPLALGEVIALNKASIKVHYLDKQHRRVQVEELTDDLSRPPRYVSTYNGQSYYHQVPTGIHHDQTPDSVKYQSSRFLIIGRV